MDIRIYANENIATELAVADFKCTTNKDVNVDVAVITSAKEFFLPHKDTYIILNTDVDYGNSKFDEIKRYIITYGFNSRATVTASSTYDYAQKIICLQRRIYSIFGKVIDPQEFAIETDTLELDRTIPCQIIKLICEV